MATTTWLGWTAYTSNYSYPNSTQLSAITSNGEAYGRYGYRYDKDLVPFMSFCRTTSTYYDCFIPYINLGTGNNQLVANTNLHNLFSVLSTENPVHFGWCQDQYYYNTYLNPIMTYAKNNGLPDTIVGPQINGSLGSFALRDGVNGTNTIQAVSEMARYEGNISSELSHGYAVFITAYAGTDGTRWYNQWVDSANLYPSVDYVPIDVEEPAKPVQPTPPPVPPTPPEYSDNFWHLWFDLGLFQDY